MRHVQILDEILILRIKIQVGRVNAYPKSEIQVGKVVFFKLKVAQRLLVFQYHIINNDSVSLMIPEK